jgi:16S rRNA (guanine527-N7)-methyltransferase
MRLFSINLLLLFCYQTIDRHPRDNTCGAMFATEAQAGGRARELVRAMADAWAFPCDDGQVAALSRYAESLLRWSERINLTAARSVDVLVAEHLPDAFALARRLAEPGRVIDVGSGGGLPAIPLALLRRDLTVELCEPVAKKVAFLRTAIRELGLAGRATVRAARAETVAQAIAKGEARAFDVAMSRATLVPEEWLALGARLVRPGGRVFALTAADALPGHGQRELYFGGRRALIEVVST